MKTLDKEFRALTRAAFARYGFAYADLITQWPAIAGEAIANWSEPERIKWPRAATDERKQGGTLVIRVVPGRGLDIQHETPRIIERINAFYGYGAIASVKIVQGALTARKPSRPALAPLRPADAQALESRLETVDDPALKEALRQLGKGVLSPRSPQAK
ncbi:DUF721 domain-containing protein [Aestuariivirga sp. YIM B02566]|uniref:DUF721 domain-containing protein n=1 Tax=Taklimakanibacter albus TaxID=2800327 RepID=A0ACC5RCL9_9HYPH|nr:DciA family protein [Aestuariivirga sp. YIM B02566]MBK1870410.1 DUF721 domain-containing protein [Aestuariivirga sp. YIM B02566]